MIGGLLDADELRELAALATRVRGRAGESAGTAAAARQGKGFELLGHDLYRPGDDPRAIDWRARMRTGELWVRHHHAEGDGGVRIVVDDSASMTEPKRRLAARIAAGIAVVASAAALPVAIDGLAGGGSRAGGGAPVSPRPGGAPLGAAPGARLDALGARRALHRLGSLRSDGRLGLEAALGRARRTVRPDEQVVVVSDLADPAPADELAAALARVARRVACVHVIDRRDGELPADVDELCCPESDRRRRVDDRAAAGFAARVGAWQRALAEAVRHRGVPLVIADAATPPRLADLTAALVATWS